MSNGPNVGEDLPDPNVQRFEKAKMTVGPAWKQTLADQEAIAEDRREDGWDVLEITAIHTDPVSIDTRQHDDWGLFHIIPDNHAEEFREFYDEDDFTEYLLYGKEIQRYMYHVIELIDPDEVRIVNMVSQFDLTRAGGLVTNAEEHDRMYSHIRTVDGTTVTVFEYDEVDPFFGRGAGPQGPLGEG